MGMADYACVYHGEGARAGGAVNDLKWDCSWENRFLRVTDRICSTVFLVETAQIIAVLFVNYKGRPWMNGLLVRLNPARSASRSLL